MLRHKPGRGRFYILFYFFLKFIGISTLLLIPLVSFSQLPPKLSEPTSDESLPTGYRIRQGDKLSIKFLYQTELNEPSLVVRPDGFISLQLIGETKAEHLTVSELKSNLEKAFDEILINPVISVSLLEFVAPRVFIGGQVGKPGSYQLRDGQTLVQVIFLAGGFTRDANRTTVLYARPDTNGKWQIQSVNVSKVLSQKNAQTDFDLRDGDYIFVPDSKISQFNKAVESFRGLLPVLF